MNRRRWIMLSVLASVVLLQTMGYAILKRLKPSQEPAKRVDDVSRNLSKCVVTNKDLHGRERVQPSLPYNEDYLAGNTQLGGRWKPKDCLADKRVAIIIPFKNRHAHLKALLPNLIPKLRRQKVDYTFYIVEQIVDVPLNRGLMKNVGFATARQEADYDCYIFNDVDTVIENDFNIYTCRPGIARHIGVLRSKNDYKYTGDAYFGGIVSFPGKLFAKVNGYTNLLFTWGKEDDALYVNDRTYKIMMAFWKEDGLSSLIYTTVIKKEKLFTWIEVSFDNSYYEMLNTVSVNQLTELASLVEPGHSIRVFSLCCYNSINGMLDDFSKRMTSQKRN